MSETKTPTNLFELAMQKPLAVIAVVLLSGGSFTGLLDTFTKDKEAGQVENASGRLIAHEKDLAAFRDATNKEFAALRVSIAYAIETGDTRYLVAGLPVSARSAIAAVEPQPSVVESFAEEAEEAAVESDAAAMNAMAVQEALPIEVKGEALEPQ